MPNINNFWKMLISRKIIHLTSTLFKNIACAVVVDCKPDITFLICHL